MLKNIVFKGISTNIDKGTDIVEFIDRNPPAGRALLIKEYIYEEYGLNHIYHNLKWKFNTNTGEYDYEGIEIYQYTLEDIDDRTKDNDKFVFIHMIRLGNNSIRYKLFKKINKDIIAETNEVIQSESHVLYHILNSDYDFISKIVVVPYSLKVNAIETDSYISIKFHDHLYGWGKIEIQTKRVYNYSNSKKKAIPSIAVYMEPLNRKELLSCIEFNDNLKFYFPAKEDYIKQCMNTFLSKIGDLLYLTDNNEHVTSEKINVNSISYLKCMPDISRTDGSCYYYLVTKDRTRKLPYTQLLKYDSSEEFKEYIQDLALEDFESIMNKEL